MAGLGVGIGEIEPVLAITSGVALARDVLCITHALVTCGDVWVACDHDIRGLDESCCHAGFDVEFSVAMEEPHTRIVGYEA